MVRRALGTVLALSTLWVGCGGVVEYDQDPEVASQEADDTEEPSGGGSWGMGDCVPCAGGECGLCSLEDGDIYQCHNGNPATSTRLCQQTGSLYSDGAGAYVCFRCESL